MNSKLAKNVRKRVVIRDAQLADVDDLITIKEALRPGDDSMGGGFILGSARDLYSAWIEAAVVKVLEVGGGSVGYAICLPDAMLRQSALWDKKDRIAFAIPITSILADKIAYFEQLAVLPRYRRYVLKLLVATLDVIFAQGHQHMFATTVREPFHNRAASGLFKRSKAQTVGFIREHYPEHGVIVSQLHYVPRVNYHRACDDLFGKTT